MLVKFIIYTVIERFSIECRKTKTKFLTHSDMSQIIRTDNPMNKSKLQASTCGRSKSAGKCVQSESRLGLVLVLIG